MCLMFASLKVNISNIQIQMQAKVQDLDIDRVYLELSKIAKGQVISALASFGYSKMMVLRYRKMSVPPKDFAVKFLRVYNQVVYGSSIVEHID